MYQHWCAVSPTSDRLQTALADSCVMVGGVRLTTLGSHCPQLLFVSPLTLSPLDCFVSSCGHGWRCSTPDPNFGLLWKDFGRKQLCPRPFWFLWFPSWLAVLNSRSDLWTSLEGQCAETVIPAHPFPPSFVLGWRLIRSRSDLWTSREGQCAETVTPSFPFPCTVTDSCGASASWTSAAPQTPACSIWLQEYARPVHAEAQAHHLYGCSISDLLGMTRSACSSRHDSLCLLLNESNGSASSRYQAAPQTLLSLFRPGSRCAGARLSHTRRDCGPPSSLMQR